MNIKKRWTVLATVALAGLAIAAGAGAQTGYQIDWWVVAGGGESIGGDAGYQMSAAAGQPAAGPLTDGDGYALNSGYWAELLPTGCRIYLPAVLKG